ncbi:hypothetical protein Cpap_0148 [Ruminiclostridium papyrosolvens DSM 2782]|uniref:Uncharacterized protein n=1 Tax=Ruminiclostridium papyrosolvens DSM 2782 TaxID=588581 RepID=F1TIG4_9FIRM|nr:DUF6133 family protein [Ruminiclostridium papyrosolvens]EGD45781.1 hypothetical protein Cpap_0148 [Ruminiclostridium papyrosolvens DSM 2782]WES33898.1 DUF6133 family protein [Ruminiclostridium papyrosolvens DSM 2782]
MRKPLLKRKNQINSTVIKLMSVFQSQSGEGFVDTAIKILMSVVIGALILAGLYSLFGNTILPTLTQRIKEMFNYAG